LSERFSFFKYKTEKADILKKLVNPTGNHYLTKEEKISLVCFSIFLLFLIQLLHHRQQGAKSGTLRTMVAYSSTDEFEANLVEVVVQET
jgi:hypothetical protein